MAKQNNQTNKSNTRQNKEIVSDKELVNASKGKDITVTSKVDTSRNVTGLSLDLEGSLSALGVKLPDFKRGLSQKLNKSDSGPIPSDTISIDGARTIRALLHDLTLASHKSNMVLPIGDIRDLPAAMEEKVSAYMDLICLRASAIPDSGALKASVLAFVETGVLDEKWLDDHEKKSSWEAGGTLSNIYEASVRRYVSLQVISPLLRSVLVARLGVRGVQKPDVITWAMQYSGWMRDSEKGLLRSALVSNVINSLERNDKLGPYHALAEALLGGVSTPSYIGLPKLLGAVSDHENGLSEQFTFECTERGFVASNPNLTQERDVLAHDCAGKPIAFEEVFSVNAPTMTPHDVSYVLNLALTLHNIDVQRSIGLDFMVEHPVWSGFIMADLATLKPSDEFVTWLDNILTFKYLTSITTLPSVDKSLMGLFDEPNRSDLHVTSVDKLYYVALAHRVLQDTLSDILASVNASAEYAGNEAVASVQALAPDKLSGGMVATNGWKLHRVFENTKTTSFIKGRSIVNSVYHIDSDMSVFHPIMRSRMADLLRQGIVGSMTTYNVGTAAISMQDILPVCLLSNMHLQTYIYGLQPEIFITTRENLANELNLTLEEINALNIRWIKRRGTSENEDIAVMANVKPTIMSFNNLKGLDKMGLTTVKTTDAAYNLLSYYLGFKDEDEIRIFTSSSIIHFRELDEQQIDIESFILTKDVAAAVKPLLKPWAYDFNPSND